MPTTMDTSKSLRMALAAENMKRAELADILGLHPNQVSRWATGKQALAGDMLNKVSAVFRMKPSEFIALGED